MRIAGCTLLILVAATTAQGADVYRSTDANGVVSYSDRPQSARDEHVIVARAAAPRAVDSPQSAPPAPAVEEAAAANPADQNAGIQGETGPTPAELAELREKNCTVARNRQTSYSQAHRLYRQLPNGEREYLSDSEIDNARVQAEADIKTWCG